MYQFKFDIYLAEFYAAVVHSNYINQETIVHIYKVEF